MTVPLWPWPLWKPRRFCLESQAFLLHDRHSCWRRSRICWGLKSGQAPRCLCAGFLCSSHQPWWGLSQKPHRKWFSESAVCVPGIAVQINVPAECWACLRHFHRCCCCCCCCLRKWGWRNGLMLKSTHYSLEVGSRFLAHTW